MKKALKIAIAFNEAHPDFYKKKDPEHLKNLDFIPYFEVDDLNPIQEYELLAKMLSEAGHKAYPLNIADDVNILIDDITKNKPDVVFNFIELYKENARSEMSVVGVLELLKVPYTGAPPMTLANCQNKTLAKRILSVNGINTSRFMYIDEPKDRYDHNLRFPIIVKPAYEDASVGIENESVVNDDEKLKKRIEYVFKEFNQPALIEEFIEGRELNVAVLGDKHPKALPISEIDFSEMPDHLYNIVSYQAKWDPFHESYHKTIPICPAKLPKKITEAAHATAVSAFKIMGCRDYARIDMRLNKDNELFVLEVNPNPDLTEGAGFMRSAEASGLTYVGALEEIIKLAYARRFK